MDYVAKAQEMIMFYGIRIITALIIFVIGKWAAGKIRNTITKVMNKRKVDETLVPFASNLIYTLLVIFVVIAALGQLGIQTTSFVAILGAAGLAVGLALQGSLSNFASGVLIILFRPFNPSLPLNRKKALKTTYFRWLYFVTC